MAARTPVAVGTNGFVDPVYGMYRGALTGSQDLLTNGVNEQQNRGRFTTRVLYFSALQDGDTIATGIPNVVAALWQGVTKTANADVANIVVTDGNGNLLVQATAAATPKGWVWLLIDDPNLTYGKRAL